MPKNLVLHFTGVGNYWKKRGIPSKKPMSFLMSCFFPLAKPIQVEDVEYYKQGRIYGEFVPTFFSAEPALVIGEPKLLRDILVKDFNAFPNRLSSSLSKNEVEKSLLTELKNEDWKRVRSIITPAFSTVKIKKVLNIFKDSSNTLLQNFKMAVGKGDRIELNKLYGTFTMDTIASAAFSTKLASYNDPENIFVKKARQAFQYKAWKFLIYILLQAPVLRSFKRFLPKVTDFFTEVVLKMVDERKKTGQRRNDFLQLLIDASEKNLEEEKEDLTGNIDENYNDNAADHQVFKTQTSKSLSRIELVAQCITFFLAGYHTSALLLSFATYLLAVNQKEQERLYEELKSVLKETNGELTYEALQKMKYLDNVIAETLRFYPPIIKIARRAAVDYKLGNTGIIVPNGMRVFYPIYAMHRDPEFFPDPERFDPDRFSPEQRAKQIPYSYLPFGTGPRNCIGMRFALMEAKVCLAFVFSVFHVEGSPETKEPLDFHARIFPLLAPKDIVVQMSIREDCPLKE